VQWNLDEYPLEPTEIDEQITGAQALYCENYGSCTETGYFSPRNGKYIAITEYPGGVHSICEWDKMRTITE
jgi:hypothetical protein